MTLFIPADPLLHWAFAKNGVNLFLLRYHFFVLTHLQFSFRIVVPSPITRGDKLLSAEFRLRNNWKTRAPRQI